jgi:hypothetical protein
MMNTIVASNKDISGPRKQKPNNDLLFPTFIITVIFLNNFCDFDIVEVQCFQ